MKNGRYCSSSFDQVDGLQRLDTLVDVVQQFDFLATGIVLTVSNMSSTLLV